MSDWSPKQRVTLTEVAKEAGVSRSAVSFVMSGRTDQRIAEATAIRIREAAARLGYRPNLTARALKTGKTNTIALVTDYVSTTSAANAMVRGVLNELRRQGSLLYTVDTQGDAKTEQQLLRNLLDRQVDGFIYASMFTRRVHVPKALTAVPTVLLNCLPDSNSSSELACVIPDEEQAGRDAAKILLQAGHQKLAFIGALRDTSDLSHQWSNFLSTATAPTERLSGIRSIVSRNPEVVFHELVVEDWTIQAGEQFARENKVEELATAFICANDALAIGVMNELGRRGIVVPRDVSVVSFDGSILAEAANPCLTTLALPHEAMGQKAAQILKTVVDISSSASLSSLRVERIQMPVVQGASIGQMAR